ncbi:hypothetical protein MPLSOD_590003 [Mesorhizobium sp. SOD10]|nr:hypothetical protein MPLSOD_590003 [Mesorhizobium sp. SOD10]
MEMSTSPGMIADARDKIPGNRRRRALGYIVIELFEFGFRFRVEDNPIFHPYLAFARRAR